MSYLYVGVGGSGAKLMHALVHLTAAGLLPSGDRELMGLLVDSDEANGNVDACMQAVGQYERCHKLNLGTKSPLFKNRLVVHGPWTPVEDVNTASLSSIFDYVRMQRTSPDDADLMDLLFSKDEREVTIFEGFRGRPAIGSAIFGKTVNLEGPMWKDLYTRALNARNQDDVSLLLAGSVFGGSGAAGVPTICQVLKQELGDNINKFRMGLVLLLPYFTYDEVEDEPMQADPQAFATATAEALKYYDEGKFLELCETIYAVGDRHPAKMPIPAVGKKDQRNPPHFVELVAGLGAIRFMSGKASKQKVVSLAGRRKDNTVTWADLPTLEGMHSTHMALLQQFTLFAVAYHYVLYPEIAENLHKPHAMVDQVGDEPRAKVGAELSDLDSYLTSYLEWLLSVSTPDRVGGDHFDSGLVNVNVFAVKEKVERSVGDRIVSYDAWRLKKVQQSRGWLGGSGEFKEKQIPDLFRNLDQRRKPNLRAIFHSATAEVSEPDASGAGKLVRAIYEACTLD